MEDTTVPTEILTHPVVIVGASIVAGFALQSMWKRHRDRKLVMKLNEELELFFENNPTES